MNTYSIYINFKYTVLCLLNQSHFKKFELKINTLVTNEQKLVIEYNFKPKM